MPSHAGLGLAGVAARRRPARRAPRKCIFSLAALRSFRSSPDAARPPPPERELDAAFSIDQGCVARAFGHKGPESQALGNPYLVDHARRGQDQFQRFPVGPFGVLGRAAPLGLLAALDAESPPIAHRRTAARPGRPRSPPSDARRPAASSPSHCSQIVAGGRGLPVVPLLLLEAETHRGVPAGEDERSTACRASASSGRAAIVPWLTS